MANQIVINVITETMGRGNMQSCCHAPSDFSVDY